MAQVGEAVTHMDQATQQNAALVEEMAAAASGLKSQAQDLVQVVAAFRLSEAEMSASAARPSPVRAPTPRNPMTKPLAKPVSKTLSKPKAVSLPPRSAAPAVPRLAPKTSTKVTPAGGDDDWEAF